MKYTKKIILFSVILFTFFYFKSSLAASLYFADSAKEVQVGDTFVVDVKLSTQEDKVNLADCALFFDQSILQVSSVNTGGSIFNLWTRTPIFSNESGKIMFIGGIPNGFSGKEGNVVRIVFVAKAPGAGSLVFSDESALYLNDGEGTKIQPSLGSLKISVLEKPTTEKPKNEWENIITEDKVPPDNINIVLGRDKSIFDNKFFISFSATDKDSGVKLYEIKEGDGDFVQSESPYVLKDQSLSNQVFVKVTDNAGNYKITEFNAKAAQKPVSGRLYWWIIIAVVLFVGFYIGIKIRSKNVRSR